MQARLKKRAYVKKEIHKQRRWIRRSQKDRSTKNRGGFWDELIFLRTPKTAGDEESADGENGNDGEADGGWLRNNLEGIAIEGGGTKKVQPVVAVEADVGKIAGGSAIKDRDEVDGGIVIPDL